MKAPRSSGAVLLEGTGNGQIRLSVVCPRPKTEEQHQIGSKSGLEEGWKSSLNRLAQALL